MYFELSRTHHPDKQSGSAERFECLTHGYRQANYYHDAALRSQMTLDDYLAQT